MKAHSSAELCDLNFKVPSEFHQLFKAAASYLGIPMKDLLFLGFRYFLEHPDNKAIRDLLNLRPNAKKRRSRLRVGSIFDSIEKRK